MKAATLPRGLLGGFLDDAAAVGQGLQVFQKRLAAARGPSGQQFGLQRHGDLAHFQVFPAPFRQQRNPPGAAVLLVRRRAPVQPAAAMRSTSEAMVLGSLASRRVNWLWVGGRAPCSSSVRRVVNWSGVTPVWAMRRRKAWLRLNQAWRSRMGRRRRAGASTGSELIFDLGLAILRFLRILRISITCKSGEVVE